MKVKIKAGFSIKCNGEYFDSGTVLEMQDSDCKPLIESGKVEEIKAGPSAPAPAAATPAPATEESKTETKKARKKK